ncbi:hypothetical protein [Phaeovulum sp.]|uniref:hypothetical protein n=1 Tax=Phaeovulum sp. TaxID=2934796 RepID=UPI003568A40F
MTKSPHFTTRRGFVSSLGFGGVSLYGLWVAYGAAPGPLALFAPRGAEAAAAGAHGGGGGVGAEADVVDEFRRLHGDFIDRFTQTDGAVQPRALESVAIGDAHEAAPDAGHGGHDMAAMPLATEAEASVQSAIHAGMANEAQAQAAPDMAKMEHGNATVVVASASHGAGHDDATGDAHAAPVEVYLLAERWYFEPAHLRLESGVAYRFRMLAADIPHGASIELGRGSRMARLRPGTVTEMEMRFDRPGDHLVYCSLYCGQGHDLMQARIEVV